MPFHETFEVIIMVIIFINYLFTAIKNGFT